MLSIAEKIRMREAGFTYKEIGDKSGESWSSIRSQMRTLKIQPKQKIFRARSSKVVHQFPKWLIHEMYWDCELSTGQIAYELNIPRTSVRSMMRRLDIPLRNGKEAWEIYKKDPFYVPTHITTAQATKLGIASGRSRRYKLSQGAK